MVVREAESGDESAGDPTGTEEDHAGVGFVFGHFETVLLVGRSAAIYDQSGTGHE